MLPENREILYADVIFRPIADFQKMAKVDDIGRRDYPISCRTFLYQPEAVAILGGSVCMGRVFYCPKTDRYQDYVLRRGWD